LTEYLHTPSDELKKKYGLMSAECCRVWVVQGL
jgi:hypothetical protein